MIKVTAQNIADSCHIDKQDAYYFLKFLVAIGQAKEVGKVRLPGVKTGAGQTLYEIDPALAASEIGLLLRSLK